MTAAVAAALLVAVWPRAGERIRYALAGAVAVSIHPLLGVGALAALLWSGLRGASPGGDAGAGLALLTDQVSLGLRAGLPLDGAMEEAAADAGPTAAAEVRRVLREARRSGLAAALEHGAGRGNRLFRICARAVRTGAPLLPAVEALGDELRHEEHTRRLASARRLPVRLLLPLALLILPGFVLLVVVPALAGALARLEIGW